MNSDPENEQLLYGATTPWEMVVLGVDGVGCIKTDSLQVKRSLILLILGASASILLAVMPGFSIPFRNANQPFKVNMYGGEPVGGKVAKGSSIDGWNIPVGTLLAVAIFVILIDVMK